MILEFDTALGQQHIFANGDELASVMGKDRDAQGRRVYSWPAELKELVTTLTQPVLVTDYHKIAALPPTVRDTVCKLFESAVRTTIYDGTRIDFEQRRYPGAWGPNIDTLLCCRALRGRLEGVRTAVEIGCGSGFIGRYLLEHAPDLQRVDLVDINPHAIRCAQDNITDARATFFLGDGLEYLKGRRFDLVVCNPPYIPRPGALGGNAYEGIDLLAYFIEHGAEHLTDRGRIVSNLSSVSESVVRPLVEQRGVRCETLDAMDVPLKVLNVLNNPVWMDFLLKDKGLRRELRDGYEFWHTVRVCGFHGA